MNLTLISAAISAALAGSLGVGVAWSLQESNINQLKVQYANTRLAEQQQAQALNERNLQAVIAAQKDAAARVANIKRDADLSRARLDGLRTAIADSMQAVGGSLDACLADDAAKGELLAQCGDRYTSVASSADTCVSDLQLMRDSWPK